MLKCDFCGHESDRVSRVAVAEGYDRLTVRHEKMYACPQCSEKKEKERLERIQKEKKAS